MQDIQSNIYMKKVISHPVLIFSDWTSASYVQSLNIPRNSTFLSELFCGEDSQNTMQIMDY